MMPIIHIISCDRNSCGNEGIPQVHISIQEQTTEASCLSLHVVCKKKDQSHFYTLAPSDLLNSVPIWGKNKTEHHNQFQNKLPKITHSPKGNNGWMPHSCATSETFLRRGFDLWYLSPTGTGIWIQNRKMLQRTSISATESFPVHKTAPTRWGRRCCQRHWLHSKVQYSRRPSSMI